MTTLDAPAVALRLHLGPEYAAWLEALEAVGAPPGGIAPPTGEAAARLLAKLGLDEADRAAVVGALPSRHAQPELSWLLERAYHAVLADIGHLDSVLRIGERDSGARSGQPDRTLRIGERDSGARSGQPDDALRLGQRESGAGSGQPDDALRLGQRESGADGGQPDRTLRIGQRESSAGGQPDHALRWPMLPAHLGTPGRCFWVFVFACAVPAIRQWHQVHAVPDSISWDTLADLGRHIRLYRRRTGYVGLDVPWWIGLHFRGALFALGRLQFNPYRLKTAGAGPQFWYDAETAEALGNGLRAGDPVLGVHIPEAGPLRPSACETSFRAAATFFAERFPDRAGKLVTCTSWLMDDQLLEYLAPDSNIVQFQRRFELVPGTREADASIIRFVFGRNPSALSEIVPPTTLEHAIVNHLSSGRHWHVRTGWLRP